MLLFEPSGIIQYTSELAFGFGKSLAKPISNVSSQVKDTGYSSTASDHVNTYDKPDTVLNETEKSILSSPATVKAPNFFQTILESIGVTDRSKEVSQIEKISGVTQTAPSPSTGLTKTIADVFGAVSNGFLQGFNVTTKGVTQQNKASAVSNVTAFPSNKTSAEIVYNPNALPKTAGSGFENSGVVAQSNAVMPMTQTKINVFPVMVAILGIIIFALMWTGKGKK